jgi:uncharacterized protein
MKQLVAAALVTFTLAMPCAFAQTPARTVAQLDPTTATAVRDLMDAMKSRDVMQMSFSHMQQNLPHLMLQGVTAGINANADLTAAQKKEAIARAAKALPDAADAFARILDDPTLMDELIAETMPLYAKHFNVDELRAMTSFYRSPLGMKMLQTMPPLMSESVQISQRVVTPRMMAMMEKLAQGKK